MNFSVNIIVTDSVTRIPQTKDSTKKDVEESVSTWLYPDRVTEVATGSAGRDATSLDIRRNPKQCPVLSPTILTLRITN